MILINQNFITALQQRTYLRVFTLESPKKPTYDTSLARRPVTMKSKYLAPQYVKSISLRRF